MRPQEGIIMRLKGLYFSLLLGFFGVLASLGNLAALNLGLAKPDTHAGSTVAGRVRIEGQLPQPNRISMSADPSCAKAHPGPAVNEEFVTGTGGALGNVIVFVSEGLGSRSFDVRNLPPGEYTVEAWHEKLGAMKQTITVAAGEAKNMDFVFKAHAH